MRRHFSTAPLAAVSILLVLAALAAARPADAQRRRLGDLELQRWDAAVSGDALVVEGGIGNLIDLESDLGLSDDKATGGRLTIFPTRRLFVQAAWTPLDLNGDEVVSRNIEFAGETFDINTRVVSKLSFDYGRASVGWFFSNANDRFRIGPMVGAAALRGDASLAAPQIPFPITASKKFEGAFGAVGAMAEMLPVVWMEIYGQANQLIGVNNGHFTDYELGVRVYVLRMLAVEAAWRRMSIDFKDNGDKLNVDIDGMLLGLSYRF
jgi:hypothetical protein